MAKIKVSITYESGSKAAKVHFEGVQFKSTDALDALAIVGGAAIQAAKEYAGSLPDKDQRGVAMSYFAEALERRVTGPSNATGTIIHGRKKSEDENSSAQ